MKEGRGRGEEEAGEGEGAAEKKDGRRIPSEEKDRSGKERWIEEGDEEKEGY